MVFSHSFRSSLDPFFPPPSLLWPHKDFYLGLSFSFSPKPTPPILMKNFATYSTFFPPFPFFRRPRRESYLLTPFHKRLRVLVNQFSFSGYSWTRFLPLFPSWLFLSPPFLIRPPSSHLVRLFHLCFKSRGVCGLYDLSPLFSPFSSFSPINVPFENPFPPPSWFVRPTGLKTLRLTWFLVRISSSPPPPPFPPLLSCKLS